MLFWKKENLILIKSTFRKSVFMYQKRLFEFQTAFLFSQITTFLNV